jgi:hypothetical protein
MSQYSTISGADHIRNAIHNSRPVRVFLVVSFAVIAVSTVGCRISQAVSALS